MADKPWKKFERRVASLFGVRRKPGSGSFGHADETASDSKHPTLFIEAKYRQNHAVRTLFEATRKLAKKERKTVVLALADAGKPGWLLVCHSDDLAVVVAEYAASRSQEEADELMLRIQRAYQRIRESFDLEAGDAEFEPATGGSAA